MEFYLFNLYQKRLVPLGIEVVEDDRRLGNPGKRRNISVKSF